MLVALVLFAASLAAGCATWSHSEPYDLGTRSTDYIPGHATDHAAAYGYSIGFATAYYPWWSLDYFYLGYHPYRPAWHRGYGYYSPWYPYDYRPGYYYPGFAVGWSRWEPYSRYGYGGYDPYWYNRYRSHAYRPILRPGRDQGIPAPVGSHGGQPGGPGYRPGIEDVIRDRETMRRQRGALPERAVPSRGQQPGSTPAASVVRPAVAPRSQTPAIPSQPGTFRRTERPAFEGGSKPRVRGRDFDADRNTRNEDPR